MSDSLRAILIGSLFGLSIVLSIEIPRIGGALDKIAQEKAECHGR